MGVSVALSMGAWWGLGSSEALAVLFGSQSDAGFDTSFLLVFGIMD
ncbi:MAG: hypothetical protein HQL53_13880 [Magnetococcales bacterium]|nr:hypothetical protein [Magnetococcales bacterium]